jgi:hypothetical protein
VDYATSRFGKLEESFFRNLHNHPVFRDVNISIPRGVSSSKKFASFRGVDWLGESSHDTRVRIQHTSV